MIPANFRTGTLELVCDGPAGSVIAELTNLDVAGGYVLGSSFSGNPSRGVGGTFWRIDDDWQSIITLTNAAPTEDHVNVELFYEGGSYRLPTIKVAGGSIATINLKELQRFGTPDADGNELPLFATSGAFCVKGSRELRSAISMERLIFNSQTSECIVIDGTNDHYVTSIQETANSSGSSQISLVTTARWNDGSHSNMTFDATYSSDNTAYVQVNGPVATAHMSESSVPDTVARVTSVLTGYGCSRGSFAFVRDVVSLRIVQANYKLKAQGINCLYELFCPFNSRATCGAPEVPGPRQGGGCMLTAICYDTYVTGSFFFGFCLGVQVCFQTPGASPCT